MKCGSRPSFSQGGSGVSMQVRHSEQYRHLLTYTVLAAISQKKALAEHRLRG